MKKIINVSLFVIRILLYSVSAAIIPAKNMTNNGVIGVSIMFKSQNKI